MNFYENEMIVAVKIPEDILGIPYSCLEYNQNNEFIKKFADYLCDMENKGLTLVGQVGLVLYFRKNK